MYKSEKSRKLAMRKRTGGKGSTPCYITFGIRKHYLEQAKYRKKWKRIRI